MAQHELGVPVRSVFDDTTGLLTLYFQSTEMYVTELKGLVIDVGKKALTVHKQSDVYKTTEPVTPAVPPEPKRRTATAQTVQPATPIYALDYAPGAVDAESPGPKQSPVAPDLPTTAPKENR